MHDLGLKSVASYGEDKAEDLIKRAEKWGLSLMTCSDVFSVSHNIGVKGDKVKYVTGSEFYCKYMGERVDLIFAGFVIDEDLLAFEQMTQRLQVFYRKKLKSVMNLMQAVEDPKSFGEKIRQEKERRLYLNSLPELEEVIGEFKVMNAFVILDRVPFVEDNAEYFRIVKRLVDLGVEAIVVFRDVGMYSSIKEEVGRDLDLCLEANLFPVVASGLYRNYNWWEIPCREALESFGWLTEQLKKRLSGGV